jgi:eukaryotic-like serine/threonine-protein kinase
VRQISEAAVSRLREVVASPDLAGTKYQILGQLGCGGMGSVYRAKDRELEREVALKILHGPLVSPAAHDRMLREARVLATLEHPGIVPVHDVGTTADGRLFYAMKLVRGQALDQTVAGKGLNERLQLFLRICEPVAFAHAQGIVHRDLKPRNIMVGPFGEVLVMDWGIAKILASTEPDMDGIGRAEIGRSSSEQTLPGTILGTPGYMSPEQARGDLAAVDARADIYSLGAVLRFLGSDVERSKYHEPRVDAICHKAMARIPADRYASVSAMMTDVTHLLEGLPLEAYPEPLTRRAERVLRKYRLPIAVVLTYIIVRALIALLSRS